MSSHSKKQTKKIKRKKPKTIAPVKKSFLRNLIKTLKHRAEKVNKGITYKSR